MLPSEAPFAIVELPNDDIWMNKTKNDVCVDEMQKKKKIKYIWILLFSKFGTIDINQT